MPDIEDIEDIIGQSANDEDDETGSVLVHRSKSRNFVSLKAKIGSKKQLEQSEELRNLQVQSFVPGTNKIYVKTWGCTHNSSDSEYMAGLLAAEGYVLTQDKNQADLWLLNSCTVKNPAEDHFRNEIEEALSSGHKVVAAGCVSQGRPGSDYLKGLSIVGVQQIDRVVEVVEETLKGNSVRLLGQKKKSDTGKKAGGASLALPKVRRNPLIEIIAINTGCLNQCTYCKTKHARGELGSYPPDEIVARAVQSFKEGVVEIWLTSEDTGAYGKDIDVTLPELLWKLVDVIPDGCRLRIGMTNPPYIMDYLDEIAEILNHDRVYGFLHVPVQSGSDAVLRDMRREYNSDEFCKIVDVLRSKVPGINIVTDIICGFPTETEEDFNDTLKVCEKYKFSSLFINQFFPRPGTPAARMKRIPTQDVKNRTRRLTDLFHSYETYTHRIGKVYKVLVTETSHDGNYYVGHNEFYEQVLVPKLPELMGKLTEVKIVKVCKFSMTGELTGTTQSPTSIKPLKTGQVSGLETKQLESRSSLIFVTSFVILTITIIVRFFSQFIYNKY